MILIQLIFALLPLLYATELFYPQSYQQGREVFKARSKKMKDKHFDRTELGYFEIDTQLDIKLTTDYTYIPQNSGRKTHLLILTSGVHGAEAFTGSAIQSDFLNHLNQTPQILDTMGILLVHAVNPYGFLKNRRVTENNVDLNRNFNLDKKSFEIDRPEYEKLNGFLNPTTPLRYSFFSVLKTYAKSIFLLLRHGRPTLANAILGGQYSFPKGIYYGGTVPEQNVGLMHRLFVSKSTEYQNILHIDLHTGYGERGTLHLFTTNELPSKNLQIRDEVFKGFTIDTGDKKDFYKITGEFTTFTMNSLSDKLVIPMTFEFGTSDSQTTMGALFSLRTSIYENQAFQFGTANEESLSRTMDDFTELFNPTSEEWRSKVMATAKDSLSTVISRFSKVSGDY